MTSPIIPDDDLPYVHNPIEYLPRRNPLVEVEMFQLRPELENRLAEWAGGRVAFEDGGLVVTIPGRPPITARLGDWVAYDGEKYWIESPDDFLLRFWPKAVEPDWPWRCYREGEGPDDGR